MSSPHSSIASIGEGLHALISRHIDRAFRAILRGEGVTTTGRVITLITGEAHPFGNFACVTDPADPASIDEAVRTLDGCGGPSAVLCAADAPEACASRLAAAGYTIPSPMPCMAVDIERLPETPLAPGYEFTRICNAAQGDAWGEAFGAGYELPPRTGAAWGPNRAGVNYATDTPLEYFGIAKRGRTVCTSVVYYHDGVTGIYGVSTLPAERGKGLGAYATAEPLRRALGRGYRVGILQASAAGLPVYQRIGFQEFGSVPLFVKMGA